MPDTTYGIHNNQVTDARSSSASQMHACVCPASPVSSERMAAILARAKEKQKQRKSKLNATPEGATDTSEHAKKAQAAATKAISKGHSE